MNVNQTNEMKVTSEIPVCPQERFAYYKRPFWPVLRYKKDWVTLLHIFLPLLLIARYNLSYHKTICYHLFQYLQRIPC